MEGVGGLNSDNKQSSTQLWNLGNKAARAVSSEDGRGGGTGPQRRRQEDRRKKQEMVNPATLEGCYVHLTDSCMN